MHASPAAMLPSLLWLSSLLGVADTAALLGSTEQPHNEFVKIGGPESLALTVDGSTAFRFVGCNIYWLLDRATLGVNGRHEVTRALNHAVMNGFTVVRTWAFHQNLFSSEGIDERTVSALDFVVSEAAKRKLRLILPLMSYWNDHAGGLKHLQTQCLEDKAYAAAWDPSTGDCPRFFASETCRSLYIKQANSLIRRQNGITGISYRSDPTIMAWEVCNECRCRASKNSTTQEAHSDLHSWTSDLHSWTFISARALKQMAPNQLVSTGSEGFYTGDATSKNPQPDHDPTTFNHEGGDFSVDGGIEAIDLLSYHLHPSTWMAENSHKSLREFIPRWISAHDIDARLLRKPVYLGEFSLVDDIEDRNQLLTDLLSSFKKTRSTAGIAAWHLTLSDVNCCNKALVPTRSSDQIPLGMLSAESHALVESPELLWRSPASPPYVPPPPHNPPTVPPPVAPPPPYPRAPPCPPPSPSPSPSPPFPPPLLSPPPQLPPCSPPNTVVVAVLSIKQLLSDVSPATTYYLDEIEKVAATSPYFILTACILVMAFVLAATHVCRTQLRYQGRAHTGMTALSTEEPIEQGAFKYSSSSEAMARMSMAAEAEEAFEESLRNNTQNADAKSLSRENESDESEEFC